MLAAITASGVLSSWLASAMKRRCCSHAASTGRNAHEETNQAMTKRAPSATSRVATLPIA